MTMGTGVVSAKLCGPTLYRLKWNDLSCPSYVNIHYIRLTFLWEIHLTNQSFPEFCLSWAHSLFLFQDAIYSDGKHWQWNNQAETCKYQSSSSSKHFIPTFNLCGYVGSMYDDIHLHMSQLYTSSSDSPFSLISSVTLSSPRSSLYFPFDGPSSHALLMWQLKILAFINYQILFPDNFNVRYAGFRILLL